MHWFIIITDKRTVDSRATGLVFANQTHAWNGIADHIANGMLGNDDILDIFVY